MLRDDVWREITTSLYLKQNDHGSGPYASVRIVEGRRTLMSGAPLLDLVEAIDYALIEDALLRKVDSLHGLNEQAESEIDRIEGWMDELGPDNVNNQHYGEDIAAYQAKIEERKKEILRLAAVRDAARAMKDALKGESA